MLILEFGSTLLMPITSRRPRGRKNFNRSQSYVFRIYNCNASVVVHKLKCFFFVKEIFFDFKMHFCRFNSRSQDWLQDFNSFSFCLSYSEST
jgi:hypothetical protein